VRSISRYQNREGQLVLHNSASGAGERRRIDEDEEPDRRVPPVGDERNAVEDETRAGGNAEEDVARGEGRGGREERTEAMARRLCCELRMRGKEERGM
jgi:hypothetical protein